MADLTIEYYWQCKTSDYAEYNIQGTNDIYTVIYDTSLLGMGKAEGWKCICNGYRFRGICKHIKEAQKEHCGWMQYINGGKPIETVIDGVRKFVCPKCRNEVISRGWGV